MQTKIAKRYADEPAIIGYNLLNEPLVPQKSTKTATVAQLQDLMQCIADGIRTVDQNHILFVEKLIGWFYPEDPSLTNKNLMEIPDTQYLIDDDNTVYEFHFYDPFPFTHQGASWLPQFPEGEYYPSYELMSYTVDSWTPRIAIASSSADKKEGDWVYFQSKPFTAGINASNQPYNFAQLPSSGVPFGGGRERLVRRPDHHPYQSCRSFDSSLFL